MHEGRRHRLDRGELHIADDGLEQKYESVKQHISSNYDIAGKISNSEVQGEKPINFWKSEAMGTHSYVCYVLKDCMHANGALSLMLKLCLILFGTPFDKNMTRAMRIGSV